MAASDVDGWYTTNLGRTGGQAGLDYWKGRINGGTESQDNIFGAFKAAAISGGETWTPTPTTPAPQDDNSYSATLQDMTPDLAPNVAIGSYSDELDTISDVYDDPDQLTEETAKLLANQPGAVSRSVGENETSQFQLNKMLEEDGAYIQNARQNGREGANRSGLLYSSIAEGAAQKAAIESAAPFALQDSQTYANQGLANQKYQNDFNLNDRQYVQDAWQNNLDRKQTNVNNALDYKMFNEGNNFTAGQNTLDRFVTTSEGVLNREWQTGEREGAEVSDANIQASQNYWEGTQNDLDRDLTLIQDATDRYIAGEGNNTDILRATMSSLSTLSSNYIAGMERIATSDMNALDKSVQGRLYTANYVDAQNSILGLTGYTVNSDGVVVDNTTTTTDSADTSTTDSTTGQTTPNDNGSGTNTTQDN